MTSAFQMLGDPTAAACIGDVCEIPQAAGAPAEIPQAASQPSERAVVIQRLDEDRV